MSNYIEVAKEIPRGKATISREHVEKWLKGLAPELRKELTASARTKLQREALRFYKPYDKQREFHRLGGAL